MSVAFTLIEPATSLVRCSTPSFSRPIAHPHYKFDCHPWYISMIGGLQISGLQISGPCLWLTPSLPIMQFAQSEYELQGTCLPTGSLHRFDSATVRHVEVADPMRDQKCFLTDRPRY